jgi:hypothetical protein
LAPSRDQLPCYLYAAVTASDVQRIPVDLCATPDQSLRKRHKSVVLGNKP